MDLFTPSVWDRLLSDEPSLVKRSVGQHGAGLRRSVLLDLERLMNARVAATVDAAAFPEASRSVLNFGIKDFSNLSPSNPGDVSRICESIVQSILRNDARLQQVTVEPVYESVASTALSFVVRAWLVLRDHSEPLNFQAAFDSKRKAFALSAASAVSP